MDDNGDVHFWHRATAVVSLLLLHFVVVVHSSCDWCPQRHSTVSLLLPSTTHQHLTAGDCGFGASPMELNVAAVTADLFRDGHACGACYQLRCRDRRLCGEDGVKVVVTDLIKQSDIQDTNRTAAAASLQFRVTKDAFAAMARQGVSADELTSNQHTAVEIDFRRTPCEYKKSLAVKVEETSKNPTHLAFRLLYQGGQTDIAAVEIAPAKSATAWRYMTRRRRRVWSTPRAPAGALRVRVVVTGGSGGKWVMSDGEVIPAEWKPGEVYDTGMRVTDIAARSCEVSCGGVEDSDGDEEEELR